MKKWMISLLFIGAALWANPILEVEKNHRKDWFSPIESYENHWAISGVFNKEDGLAKISFAQSLLGRQGLVFREHITFRPFYKEQSLEKAISVLGEADPVIELVSEATENVVAVYDTTAGDDPVLEEGLLGLGLSLRYMQHWTFLSLYAEIGSTYYMGDYWRESKQPDWEWVPEAGAGVQFLLNSNTMWEIGYLYSPVRNEILEHKVQMGLLFGF